VVRKVASPTKLLIQQLNMGIFEAEVAKHGVLTTPNLDLKLI
jgi:hypothetical protein